MGEKGIGSGPGKVRAARGKGGGGKSIRSFVLRTYIVGRMGVKKLHIDWWVKVVPAYRGGHDYPNTVTHGGLLARILILLQNLFVHLTVKQMCDRRQLIKVEVVYPKLFMGSFCKH